MPVVCFAEAGKADDMFLLVIRTEDEGALHYWNGGEIWTMHPEGAVRFIYKSDADATVDVLRAAGLTNPTMHVVPLPNGID